MDQLNDFLAGDGTGSHPAPQQDLMGVGGGGNSFDPLAASANRRKLEAANAARMKKEVSSHDGSNVWNPDMVDRSTKSAGVQAAMAKVKCELTQLMTAR
jgi:hypothetical protein